ncbi:protein kinase [Catenuloplanes sp. NPDC051500]|uniref:serine/threonine protein kinase n=1 Tax=Catenuloplanes sp. NPDC051500 TaxID=3363959 RepID=UPI00378F2AAF
MSDTTSRLIAGRYRLIRPLGQGAMGRVWLALDETLRREVAVKELVPPPGLDDAARQELRERSMREARAIARLDQPNVVRIHDVVHDGDEPWIVMEFVRSRPLHQILKADGPMNPAQVARIGLGVLAALRAAHLAGLLHRDVKPANVLIGDDGRVVLTDFGLAIGADDATVTRTGVMLGSPAYLAPERATDGVVGPASDLWSLGATLYTAVEGRTPYTRSSSVATLTALATELPPPPVRAGALLPVLEGLLRKDPAARIGADEAERLLRRAAEETGPAADSASAGIGSAGASGQWAASGNPAATRLAGASGQWASDTAVTGAAGASGQWASNTATTGPAGTGGTAGASGRWAATGDTAVTTPPALAPSGPPSIATAPDVTPARRPRRAAQAALIAAALIGVAIAALFAGTLLNTGNPALVSAGLPSADAALPLGGVTPSAVPTVPAATPTPMPSASSSASASPNRSASASATGSSAPAGPRPTRTSAAPKPLTPVATDRPIVNRGSSMCIDVPDSNPDTPQSIHLWDCHDPVGGGEDFDLTGDGLLHIVGRCLQVDGPAAGSALHVAACDSGWDQIFSLTDAGALVNTKTGRCVEVPDGSSTNGTHLRLADCTGTDRQRWFVG